MSRDLTSSLESALSNSVIEPFFAVDLNFDTNPLHVWTGVGDVVIDGKTYVGSEEMLNVETIQESNDVAARGAVLTLTGIPSQVLSIALNAEYQGRTGTIYLGVHNDTTQYTELFSGYIDTMNILEGADTTTVRVSIESKLVRLEVPSGIKYTSSYLKSQYPADRGLDFVESLAGKRIVWGATSE